MTDAKEGGIANPVGKGVGTRQTGAFFYTQAMRKYVKECMIMKKNVAMLLAVCTAAAALSFGAYAEEAKSFKIASDTVFKPFEN